MRVDEARSFEEIAARLNYTVVAVKAAYYRGLRELKRRLNLN
jgi:DNA-directed RNA polymerase specialized sigma24 family protein